MATLYELTDKYRQLYEMNGEIDEELFRDTADSITDAIEDKAVGYAQVIKMDKADIDSLADEIKRLQDRKKSIQKHQTEMKLNLIDAFDLADISKVKTPQFTISKTAGRESVEITDEMALPVDAFETKQVVSKTKVTELLKKGREVNGAKLVHTPGLSIR